MQERAQYKEALETEARKAFSSFLEEIAQGHYGVLRNAVNNLAIADCLLSLAHVALQEGYVRPEFTDDDTLEIVEGRHPMVEALRSDPFVPNSVLMGGKEPQSKGMLKNAFPPPLLPHTHPLCSSHYRAKHGWQVLFSSDDRAHCRHGTNWFIRSCSIRQTGNVRWYPNKDGR